LGGRVDKEYWKYGLEIDFFFFSVLGIELKGLRLARQALSPLMEIGF
jgi:hypothetical protein